MPRKSLKTTTPTSPSTQTLETIPLVKENLTSLALGFHVQAVQSQEPEQVLNTKSQPYFERFYASSGNVSPSSASLNNPWELSLADLEQSWGDSEWLATKANVKLCRRKNSVQVTSENDFLLFPTPTANLGTYRQAGTNRLETWLRGNGLIPNGSQLNAIAYALIQGFPSNWFQALAHPQNTLPIGLLVPLTRQDASEPESLQAEPSPPHRPPSPSSESCTSTHCSNCNSFDNSIPDSSPWKFCLLKGSYTEESDLTTCEDFIPIIPYEVPPKTRRFKGEGSGNIRTRKSHDTDQYNYHFELWKDKKRLIKSTTYIPKGKLAKIREMEANKEPVEAILRELGKQISADGILTRGEV